MSSAMGASRQQSMKRGGAREGFAHTHGIPAVGEHAEEALPRRHRLTQVAARRGAVSHLEMGVGVQRIELKCATQLLGGIAEPTHLAEHARHRYASLRE